MTGTVSSSLTPRPTPVHFCSPLLTVYSHFLFNVGEHPADVGWRDLPVHFGNVRVEKLEGAEGDPGWSSIMVAEQHFTHYLESFGNGLENRKTRGGENHSSGLDPWDQARLRKEKKVTAHGGWSEDNPRLQKANVSINPFPSKYTDYRMSYLPFWKQIRFINWKILGDICKFN